MTELIESDPSWSGDVDRARPTWLHVVAVVAVVLIALAVGLFVWADDYQPLVLGSGSYGAGSQLTTSMDDSTDFHFQNTPTVTNALGTEYQVPTAAGDTVELLFTISNDGSQPVRIRSFGPGSGVPADVTLGRFESASELAGTAAFQTFAPFTLGHHESRSVVVTLTYAKLCPSGRVPLFEKGGGIGFGSMTVAYSYRGIRHTAKLSLPKTFFTLESAPLCFS